MLIGREGSKSHCTKLINTGVHTLVNESCVKSLNPRKRDPMKNSEKKNGFKYNSLNKSDGVLSLQYCFFTIVLGQQLSLFLFLFLLILFTLQEV